MVHKAGTTAAAAAAAAGPLGGSSQQQDPLFISVWVVREIQEETQTWASIPKGGEKKKEKNMHCCSMSNTDDKTVLMAVSRFLLS